MIIPCEQLRTALTDSLKSKVSRFPQNKIPCLLAVLIGDAPDQLSYVRIKRKIAKDIGVGFEFLQVSETTEAGMFYNTIQERSRDPSVTGVIIQQPLPRSFDIEKVYACIPPEKEIEGHTKNSHFVFPLVQACMIGLQWAFQYTNHQPEEDLSLPFSPKGKVIEWLQNKHIVIAGKGITTGRKIATYLETLGIPFVQTDSQTQDGDSMYRKADIIITGVGKHIISRDNIKKGVVLFNFGLRKENGADGKVRLRGDYDEEDIKNVASLYTKTPNGLGPIDVMCLYGNLIAASTS